MSTIASQIERIKGAKSVLAKLAARLGFYPTETAAEAELIGDIAESLDKIEAVSSSELNAGVPAADGGSTKAPKGYYPGEFTITNLTPNNVRNGVTIMGIEGSMSGTEGINLQEKSVDPNRTTQQITPDSGYNGLSKVTVSAIPNKLQDVEGIAAPNSVLSSAKTYKENADGTFTLTSGTIADYGPADGQKTIEIDGTETTNKEYISLPRGYYADGLNVTVDYSKLVTTLAAI